MKAVDPRTVSVAYNAVVNNYFHERFAREACGRRLAGIERRTTAQLVMLARLLSPEPARPEPSRPGPARPSQPGPPPTSPRRS
jgi:hypothetical protein